MGETTFTAAQIAAALQRPKRGVLESLRGASSTGTRIISGNQARAWSKDALPGKILTALEDAAARRKTSVDALLAVPPPFWRAPYLLSELSQESVERASLLQRAITPALSRLDNVNLTCAEFERLGVDDYRRTFGHSVSTRH